MADAKKFTLEQLAVHIDKSVGGLHKMFKNQNMTIDTLERISRVLEVPMTYWFEEERSVASEQLIEYRRQNEGTIEDLRADLKYFREECIALKKENSRLKGENPGNEKKAV